MARAARTAPPAYRIADDVIRDALKRSSPRELFISSRELASSAAPEPERGTAAGADDEHARGVTPNRIANSGADLASRESPGPLQMRSD